MYKVPNVQLDDERIEEILDKEVDNLSKLPISESLSDSSESMNKFLTAEIGFHILSQKQSITNSTIEADKSAGNGNSMNENVTDETVDKIENTTENNSQTNDAKKAESANQRVTWRSTRGASTRESISNKPNVYVVSAKSTKFRQEESVENFQWLLDHDKIILELKD